jgi:hypothetical protein
MANYNEPSWLMRSIVEWMIFVVPWAIICVASYAASFDQALQAPAFLSTNLLKV